MNDTLEASLKDIHGWFSLEEARLLHDAVLALEPGRALTLVEIGAWKGRSAIALAGALKKPGAGLLYSIDPHAVTRRAARRSNLESAGLSDFVRPIRSFSHDARKDFPADRIDFLFVDGSHEYEDVVTDIDDWTHLVPAGGAVAFNDPSRSGVYRALLERVVKAGAPFTRPRLSKNTLLFDVEPAGAWNPRRLLEMARTRVFLTMLFTATRLRRAIPAPLQKAMRSAASLACGVGVRATPA